jgi:hypothetical protein
MNSRNPLTLSDVQRWSRDGVHNAASFAEKAHKYQKRNFGGGPYVTHPIAVHNWLLERGTVHQVVLDGALLHDVLEDTEVRERVLASLFGDEVFQLVSELTWKRNPGESYTEFHERKLQLAFGLSREAARIKCADIATNVGTLDLSDPAQFEFGRRYIPSRTQILHAIPRDHCPEIWDAACFTVEGKLADLRRRLAFPTNLDLHHVVGCRMVDGAVLLRFSDPATATNFCKKISACLETLEGIDTQRGTYRP